MSQPSSNQEPARNVPTAGMTPLGHGQQMYVPDVQPIVDLNVPIPSAVTAAAEGYQVGGPSLNG